jgi:hypothetical protein
MTAPDGPAIFARYAYPPNALGYCGPPDDGALLRRGAAAGGSEQTDLVALARAFDGAWPYLEFIAEVAGRSPLDPEVVEAYWLGTGLLDKVDLAAHGEHLLALLRARAGPAARIPAEVDPGARCDHTFHCFEVYPWMGLLAAGRGGDKPREILDRCRIRWGRVVAAGAERVEVTTAPLTWDGAALGLGEPRDESAVLARDGLGFVEGVRAGDWVALHWDWVCDRLDAGRLEDLRRSTLGHLEIVNRRLALTRPNRRLTLGDPPRSALERSMEQQ